ncbi:hypothetical protein CesoFtcFv8_021711 [Champsocephalus esox]|uniref:Uncharacterized protein n=1 Tax=Champsocephalus esox TaxID=159716 RepID=A0AAN8B9L9_9TELE|nr:hypothetical protein CesoFtcFv8_021711 [Champsocephalus esox]
MCGCWSSVIRAVLVTEYLLLAVRGDGTDPAEELDIKYVLIGAGTGVFLVAGCIILMACREKLCDGYTAPRIHSQHSNRSRTSRAGSVTVGQLTNFTKM